MHLRGRHFDAAPFHRQRGAGIVGEVAFVAQIGCGAGGRIDTHMAHRAHDKQALDASLLQLRLQIGAEKAVDMVFQNHRLALKWQHACVDLRTFRAGLEKRRIRA